MSYQQIAGFEGEEKPQSFDPLLEDHLRQPNVSNDLGDVSMKTEFGPYEDDLSEDELDSGQPPLIKKGGAEVTEKEVPSLEDSPHLEQAPIIDPPDRASGTISSFSHRYHKATIASLTNEVDSKPPTIPGWPTNSSTLQESWAEYIPRLILDIILAATPAAFAAMGLAAFILNGEAVEKYPWGTQLILFSSTYGVTIFPILFAMIVGSALSSIASFLLEHGYKLLYLEQLTGSVTIMRAVKTQFLLRAFNWQALALLVLWALSPLGGQGSLRLIQVKEVGNQTNQMVTYLDTSSAWLFNRMNLTALGGDGVLAKTLVTTSLMSVDTASSSAMDLWGNVNIPLFPLRSSSNSKDWVAVPQPQANSGLIGIPVIGLPQSGKVMFNITSRHFLFDCTSAVFVGRSGLEQTGFFAMNASNGSLWEMSPHFLRDQYSRYTTFAFRSWPQDSRDDAVEHSAFLDNGTYYYDNELDEPRKIAVMQANTKNNGTMANCSVFYPTYESSVRCDLPGPCRVTHMRNVTESYNSSVTSPLEDYTVRNYLSDALSDLWPAPGGRYYSATEQFLATGLSPFRKNQSSTVQSSDDNSPDSIGGALISDFSGVSSQLFSYRFGLFFNTLYSANNSPYARLFPHLYTLDADQNSTYNPAASGFRSTTIASIEEPRKVYAANTLWLIMLLISSFTLLFVGILGTVARYRMAGYPLFGSVSTLTFNNPHVSVPFGGSTLDPYKRARMLGNLKIQVGDLRPDQNVGQIGIASMDEGRFIGPLNKRRLYF